MCVHFKRPKRNESLVFGVAPRARIHQQKNVGCTSWSMGHPHIVFSTQGKVADIKLTFCGGKPPWLDCQEHPGKHWKQGLGGRLLGQTRRVKNQTSRVTRNNLEDCLVHVPIQCLTPPYSIPPSPLLSPNTHSRGRAPSPVAALISAMVYPN